MKGYCKDCGSYTENGHWYGHAKDNVIICDNCFQKIGLDLPTENVTEKQSITGSGGEVENKF